MYTDVFRTTCTFYTDISLITFTHCTRIQQTVSAVALFYGYYILIVALDSKRKKTTRYNLAFLKNHLVQNRKHKLK